MARTFLVTALWAIHLCLLQGAGPDDVAGVPWDSTPAQVRQLFSVRPGVVLKAGAETTEALTFVGGVFADFDVKSWLFEFTGGKLSSVRIAIKSKPGQDARGWFLDQDFDAINKVLQAKYGKPQATQGSNFQARSWQFPSPYAKKKIEVLREWSGKGEPLEVTYTCTRGRSDSSKSKKSKDDV
jgi:hypothetical protein